MNTMTMDFIPVIMPYFGGLAFLNFLMISYIFAMFLMYKLKKGRKTITEDHWITYTAFKEWLINYSDILFAFFVMLPIMLDLSIVIIIGSLLFTNLIF